jgi:hypothetical protein
MTNADAANRFRVARPPRVTRMAWLLLIGSPAIGVVAALLSLGGHTLALVGLAAIIVPILLWRWPAAGVIMVVLAANLVEQFSIPIANLPGTVITDEVGFFTSLSDGAGLAGVLVSPLELTIVIMVGVWLTWAAATRNLSLPRSHLAAGFAGLFAIVLFAEVLGRLQGGDLRESLREIRPWLYLSALYLLGSQLLMRRSALRGVLWAIVIGAALKGMQGVLIFLSYLDRTKPNSYLSHDQAVFFDLYILLTAALWIFGHKGRLRTVATALLPIVLVANLANNRRAAWLILLAGVPALLLVGWLRLPQRRPLIKAVVIGLAVTSVVYFPLFWNSSSLLAQPARAVRSAVNPYERDLLSNEYRHYEDANLMLDIKHSTPLGQGFGVPIDYTGIPFYDLTRVSTSLRYEPHDGILYVWLRLGTAGAVAFWFVIGAAFIAAGRLVRIPDQELALFGMLVIFGLLAYVIEGKYDLGLSSFRVAPLMGCLLGGLEAARRLSAASVSAPSADRVAA